MNVFKVYKYQSWNTNSIPVFEPGEEFEMSEFLMTEGTTTAPPLLSEVRTCLISFSDWSAPAVSQEDLITKMDDNGIGTDATIHDHIKTVSHLKHPKMQVWWDCKMVGIWFRFRSGNMPSVSMTAALSQQVTWSFDLIDLTVVI